MGTLLVATHAVLRGAHASSSSTSLATGGPTTQLTSQGGPGTARVALAGSIAPGKKWSSSVCSALTLWRARGGDQLSEQIWSLSLSSHILCVAGDLVEDAFCGLENGQIVYRRALGAPEQESSSRSISSSVTSDGVHLKIKSSSAYPSQTSCSISGSSGFPYQGNAGSAQRNTSLYLPNATAETGDGITAMLYDAQERLLLCGTSTGRCFLYSMALQRVVGERLRGAAAADYSSPG
ncbi:unnamed protein product, partial [Amoebophrya sp. A25]|eukprot:GSA25T00005892001.1